MFIIMKQLLTVLFIVFLSATTKAQMISVTGGNLNLHGKNKGYIEVEAMQHITENVAAHISYTKTIGGYDIAMVGGRYGFFKNRVGAMLSACFMVNHKTMAMWGVDVRPIKRNPISIVYSQSTDTELKTIGVKFPLIHNNKNH
jgi:hypothetical protein